MKFIDNFKDNKELREKYNTKCLDLQVAIAENKRKDIIIDEFKEAIGSVRKIWMDANNEKELEIVRLHEEINDLKRKIKELKEKKKVVNNETNE